VLGFDIHVQLVPDGLDPRDVLGQHLHVRETRSNRLSL
jgi:hypothetical protein